MTATVDPDSVAAMPPAASRLATNVWPSTGVPLGPERADDDGRAVAERPCAVTQGLVDRGVAAGREGPACTAWVAAWAAGQREPRRRAGRSRRP